MLTARQVTEMCLSFAFYARKLFINNLAFLSMATTKTERSILIENPQTAPKIASVVLPVGAYLQTDGAGHVTLLAPGNPVEGLNLSPINSTDVDFASNKLITYDGIDDTVDRFYMPVTNGTAANALVGNRYNVFTDGYGLDVSTYNTLAYNTLAVSTFAAGHTITGGTSAATATISYLPGTNTLVVVPVTGTLIAGETITDGTSGATAKIVTYVTGGTQFEVTKPANVSCRVEVKVIQTK